MSIASLRGLRRPPCGRWRRFLGVGLVLARLYAGYRLISWLGKRKGRDWEERQRHAQHLRAARAFYRMAVRYQGLLIKTGQFLSGRPDVVPDEYVQVLSTLQDEVPPQPYAVIRRVVEAELGQSLAALFAEFEPRAVASASLAQVHRARLQDGRTAAVKVQYPGIERLIEADLRNIALFTAILKRLDQTLDFRFVAEELGRVVPRELDFVEEGRSAERIAANFSATPEIVVPEIYWEHTTRRVLVMQYLEGTKITDVETLRANGIDPAAVAALLLRAFSEMLLRHGFFHADPHPGNLLVAPGPRLVLLDFGQVKEIGPAFRFVFAQMTRALTSGDSQALGRSFRALGFRMRDDTPEGYEELGDAYVGRIARQMSASNAGWADPAMFEDSYRQVLRILRANPLVKVPPDLLFVGRVMGLLNGLSMTLRSRTNLLLEMARLLDEEAGAAALPARLHGEG